jgi:hypothetical protein
MPHTTSPTQRERLIEEASRLIEESRHCTNRSRSRSLQLAYQEVLSRLQILEQTESRDRYVNFDSNFYDLTTDSTATTINSVDRLTFANLTEAVRGLNLHPEVINVNPYAPLPIAHGKDFSYKLELTTNA